MDQLSVKFKTGDLERSIPDAILDHGFKDPDTGEGVGPTLLPAPLRKKRTGRDKVFVYTHIRETVLDLFCEVRKILNALDSEDAADRVDPILC